MRKELQDIASAIEPVLREYRIVAAYIFGSYARGTMTDNSDIDILVDYGEFPVGLFEHAKIKRRLAQILGKDVDLVALDALKGDFFSNTVNREKICIYSERRNSYG